MAMVQLCCKIPSNEQFLPIPNTIKHNETGYKYSCVRVTGNSRFSSVSDYTCKRWHSYPTADISAKAVKASGGAVCNREFFPKQNVVEPLLGCVGSFSERDLAKSNLHRVCSAAESRTSEGQIRTLETYLSKLNDGPAQNFTESSGEITELHDRSGEIDATEELDSLDSYLGKLNTDARAYTYDDQTTESNLVAAQFSVSKSSKRSYRGKLKGYTELRSKDSGRDLERHLVLQQSEETSDLYLIGALISIDIAVFLFEIASPIRNSSFELFSLPLLYGAKINELILVGEWWRLLTPMFLHSGIFHIALGCWALLTFGPQVCKSYGSFAFFLIYILGGISGNLTSFLHTPEPTVGGTEPVFAIIGAWLIYQVQNKDVIAKDVSEGMFQKAILATVLSFSISNFGPVIDNWAHLGAAFTGIIYGYLTCPIVQLGDGSSRNSQEERITVVRQNASPLKSIIMFTIFVVVLSSLLFVFEPPLHNPYI